MFKIVLKNYLTNFLVFDKQKVCNYLVLIQTCFTGIAYNVVEIPFIVYTIIAYSTSFLYILLSFGKHIRYIWLFSIPIIYFLVNLFWSTGTGYFKFDFINILMICQLLLLYRNDKKWVIQNFRKYIIIMSLLGIICYLSFYLNLGIPYSLKSYYVTRFEAYYVNYHFSYLFSDPEAVTPRLCGLYNEPGYFGTILALVLILDNCKLKKKGNICIFIAAIFTWSLAFWLILILFFIIRYIKNYKYSLTLLSSLFIFIYIANNVQFENPQLNILLERFQFEDGKLKGDNRTTSVFDNIYDGFIDSNDKYFGWGSNALTLRYDDLGTLSYKTFIINYGIIGFLILWGVPFICSLFYAKLRWKPIVFILLFFISTYQRPHLYTNLFITILFGGIDYILNLKSSFNSLKFNE